MEERSFFGCGSPCVDPSTVIYIEAELSIVREQSRLLSLGGFRRQHTKSRYISLVRETTHYTFLLRTKHHTQEYNGRKGNQIKNGDRDKDPALVLGPGHFWVLGFFASTHQYTFHEPAQKPYRPPVPSHLPTLRGCFVNALRPLWLLSTQGLKSPHRQNERKREGERERKRERRGACSPVPKKWCRRCDPPIPIELP
ncbi:hypothetical protein LZ30DRAFT_175396 [Colletotrichum cereale]|nr:hypothetical protein LZ30DRAFT_175396 [Colletotrichum cereale]